MKPPSLIFKPIRWLQALVGIVLVMLLAAIIGIPANFNNLKNQITSNSSKSLNPFQQNTPTPKSVIYLPAISNFNQVNLITDWKKYIDNNAGFSFRYPKDWILTDDSKEGYLARIRPETTKYHRSISFSVTLAPELVAATSDSLYYTALYKLKDLYGEHEINSVTATTLKFNNISGIHITNFSPSAGAHTEVFFSHGNKLIAVTLVVGGSDGGISQYDWPTSQQDYDLFMQILNTLEFTSQ